MSKQAHSTKLLSGSASEDDGKSPANDAATTPLNQCPCSLRNAAKKSTRFFNLPFEIRQEIFYIVVIAQREMYSYFARDSGYPTKSHNLVGLEPWWISDTYRDRESKLHFRYWGLRESANLYPINRQWYSEIQQAFFRKFNFWVTDADIQAMQATPTDTRFCFSFLPSYHLIQNLTLSLSLPWNSLDPIWVKNTTQQYRTIATELPSLAHIHFRFFHDHGDPAEGILGKNDVMVVLSKHSTMVVETVLALVRPFKHVSEVFMALRDPTWYAAYNYPTVVEGVLYGELIIEAAHRLRAEIEDEEGVRSSLRPGILLSPLDDANSRVWAKDEWRLQNGYVPKDHVS